MKGTKVKVNRERERERRSLQGQLRQSRETGLNWIELD